MDESRFSKRKSPHGHFTVTPLPSPEELSEFYATTYFQESASTSYQAEYSQEELDWRDLRSAVVLHAVDDALGEQSGTRSLLEVGCGEGFFLRAAVEAGYQVHGVDFASFGVEKFNPEMAPHVEVGDAFSVLDSLIGKQAQFTVCVLENVLEHVVDPVELLGRLSSLIHANGVAVITVPNDFSAVQAAALSRGHIERESWFQPPVHLQYFNVDTLPAFCRQCGFEVLDLWGGFPIDFFLFHPGSNYDRDATQGKAAHHARVALDLLMASRGVANYLRLCRALAGCGVGRVITIVIRPEH